MRRLIIAGTSGLVLLAGVGLAAAQGMTPPAANQNTPGQSSAMQKPAGQGEVSLTEQQKQMIWQTLSRAKNEKTPSNFQASVGTDVPRGHAAAFLCALGHQASAVHARLRIRQAAKSGPDRQSKDEENRRYGQRQLMNE